MLIRNARLVPVRTPAPADGPVDVRLDHGVVSEVAAGLQARHGEQVIDADGRWALPGLWDSHVHMRMHALSRRMVDLSVADDAASAVQLVAAHAERLDRDVDSLILGYGHRSAAWPRQPTVAELDAVSGAHPVILTSGDAHHGWLNSAALRLLGLPPRTTVISELAWFALTAQIEALNTQDVEAAHRAAVMDAAARGVVGVVDFDFGNAWAQWPRYLVHGVDLLRVRAAAYPDSLEKVIAAGLRTGDALSSDSELLRMGPLKIITDGSLNTRTAYCEQPYVDAADLRATNVGATDTHDPFGRPNYSADELGLLMARAHRHGLQVALHAIGDAAVREALDAFAATGARGSIEHAQLMRRDDIRRLAQLGVRASVQPAHLLDDRDVVQRCWPDRADRCFPFRALLDAGADLSLGSDAPVAALDPWLAMSAAVHRSGDERDPWRPEQSITVAEALAASTDGQPTIAPGGRGDVVLVEADPLQPHVDTRDAAAVLSGMRVAATVVAGRLTYCTLEQD